MPRRSGAQLCHSGDRLLRSSGCPANHIPTGAPCDSCHVGAGSSVPTLPVPNGAKFSGSRMNTRASATIASPATLLRAPHPASPASRPSSVSHRLSPMGPGSHIPSGSACESCHLGSLANVAGLIPARRPAPPQARCSRPRHPPARKSTPASPAVAAACHEAGYVWMGVTAYPISPSVKTLNAQYTGFQTRPRAAAGTFNIADATHPAPVTAASAIAAPIISAAATSPPTTFRTPPPRSAPRATPAATTR